MISGFGYKDLRILFNFLFCFFCYGLLEMIICVWNILFLLFFDNLVIM